MTVAANNKANVSTTRGVVGGYLFRAPLGTTLPSKTSYPSYFNTALADPWENVGYLSTDGVSRSTDGDTDELQDMNLDVVDVMEQAKVDTVTFHPMEVSPSALKVQYGSSNVEITSDGVVVVHSNWNNSGEHYSYIARFVLKNGRRWDRVIPDAVVSSLGEETQNKSTGTGRDVTLKLAADANGDTIIDYYQPLATPADATLSALSIGSLTLSPTFDKDVTSYTTTTSNSSDTVTATATKASDGATVVITVNGSSIASGGTATWVTGTNTVVITVTNGDSTKVYTVTVTKGE